MSKNIGKQGEAEFIKKLAKYGYQITDVSEDQCYQLVDIDFVIDNEITVEVKYDRKIHKTKNLYLETENINSRQWNGDGWFKRCRADYLAYGDYYTKQFYIIAMDDLRQYVNTHILSRANCGYESKGILVNLEQIKHLIKTI